MDTESISLVIGLILVLIVASGFFSMAEIAVVSARKARLEMRAEEGKKEVRAALTAVSQPDRLLPALQVGITLSGICIGALGGTVLADWLSVYLKTIPYLAPYSYSLSLALVVTVLAFILMIFGEMAPKQIALTRPESVVMMVTSPLSVFAGLLSPIVALLSKITGLVLRFLPVNTASEPAVTEEEVYLLLEHGAQEGTFDKAEQDMVQRIFRLDDIRASALMTPRTQVDWLDSEEGLEAHLDIVRESVHSRFPVGRESLDDVVGIVYARDILTETLAGRKFVLAEHLHTPLFVPRSMSGLEILESFKKSGTHIALVIDEYGGMLGLITLNDILEKIVGVMPLAEDAAAPPVVQRADGSWLVDGMLPVEELKSLLAVEELPAENRENYQTLGGFVTSYLEHIPAASEHFVWKNWRFEIMDMDRARVDKVLVSTVETAATAEN